jgi:hypothetical protein
MDMPKFGSTASRKAIGLYREYLPAFISKAAKWNSNWHLYTCKCNKSDRELAPQRIQGGHKQACIF